MSLSTALALALFLGSSPRSTEGLDCNCDSSTCVRSGAATPDARARSAPATAPAKGPVAAKVTVVAWSDFECPFCARAAQTLKELQARYQDRVRFVFRHRPLPFHEQARELAAAAMAAHEQGRFWEFHDALFAKPAKNAEAIESAAREAGVDLARLRAYVGSGRANAIIDQDLVEAERLDVKGTPTFFVNGRRLVGAQPLSAFVQLIDEELAK